MTRIWTADAIAQLRRAVGDIGEAELEAILALDPSWEEVEEAVMWTDGRIDASAGLPPPSGKAGQVAEILAAAVEEEAEPAPAKTSSGS